MWIAFCLVLGIAADGFAQDAQDDGAVRRPPRDSMRQGREYGLAGPMRVLVREMQLDDEQQKKVGKIWDAHVAAEQALREEMKPPAELSERMGELRREMRAAHDARNKERVVELRKELEAIQQERTKSMGPLREKLDEMQDTLHDDLRGVMREDQVDLFERIWREQIDKREARRAMLRNPSTLKAAVETLEDLTQEQKEGVRDAFEAYKRWMREANLKPGAYSAGREEQMKKLYTSVMAQLTPEQQEKVNKELDPEQRRARKRRAAAAIRAEEKADAEAKSEADSQDKPAE